MKNNILRRVEAIAVTVFLFLAILPATNACAASLVSNGGFENGTSGWYRDSGAWDKEYSFSDDAHSGTKALRIKGTSSLYVRCAALKMNVGAKISFGGFYKVNSLLSGASYPAVKIEFFDANKSMISEEANFVREYKNPEIGKWTKVTEEIEPPQKRSIFSNFCPPYERR